MENNPDVLAAKQNLASTRALKKGTLSPFLPTIAATASSTRSGGADAATNASFSSSGAALASLTLSQNLFAGFADLARRERASANEFGAIAAYNLARSKARTELAAAFQGLVYAKAARRLSEEIVARREQNMRLVELRFESGRENKGSLLLSQANLEQARYDLLRSIDQIPTAQAQLRRALGDDDPGIDVAGEVPISPPPKQAPDLQRLAESLPELHQARATSDSARAGIDIARAPFFPSLALTGSLGRQGDDFFPRAERWSAGLTLSIPLFDGGRDLYGVRSASALLSAAEASQAGVQRQTITNLTQTYTAYVQAEQKLKVDTTYVHATLTRSEIARRKYENGLLTFEDWDIIESDLINRQRTLIATRRDRVIAERAWLQAINQEETP